MRRFVAPLLVIGMALTGAVATGGPTTAVEPTAWDGVVLGDGFEYGLGDWSTTESGGAGTPHWRRTGSGPGSGIFAVHIAGADKAADQSLTTAALPLGTSPQLVFRHRWQFERSQGVNYDGGVIEFSLDDGQSWQDLDTQVAVPYTGTIASGSGNPLSLRQGFTGTSTQFPTYLTVTLPLPSLADQTARFRFRFGADEAVASGGWWIDDVEITNSAAGAVQLPDAPTNVQVTPTSATSVAVTFAPAGGSPSRPVVAHLATCTGGGRTATGSTRQTEIELSGLAAGAAYSCTVRAWTTAGVGPASAPASFAPTIATSRVATASAPETTGLTPAQRAALRSAAKPGSTTRIDDQLGVPTVVWAADRGPVAAPGSEGERRQVTAARGHLARLATAYRLSAQDVADARVHGVHDLGRGTVVVQFSQEVRGVPVWHERINVVMTRGLGLVGLTGFLLPRNVTQGAVRLSAREALAAAFEDLTGHQPAGLAAAGQRGGYDRFTGSGLLTPARVQRVFHRLPRGLVSAYYLELRTLVDGEAREFGYVVSAGDGRILNRTDLVSDDNVDVDYRVWANPTTLQPYDGPQGSAGSPNPTGVPDGYQPSLTTPNLVQGPLTGDPWLGLDDTETSGNNVDAYTDTADPDGFTPGSTDVRAPLVAGAFDYTYDFGLGPTANVTQANAALTQLFYDVNYLHDWFYDSGFDEAAGNAQVNNYGRGGTGNDPILAEDQDRAGTESDNANMSTPADGGSPRMQMYVWTGPSDAGVDLTPGGSLPVGVASFGPSTFDVTNTLVMAVDGVGPTSDACEALTNAGAVSGDIAVVDRGTCDFVEKAQRAQAAGAVGMILVNNTAGLAPLMGCGQPCPAITIGTLSITQADGDALKANLGSGPVTGHLHRAPLPLRDGALDSTIVSHEWGHYLSNRLAALGNPQASAMGEGWSDFVALLQMVQPEDVADLDGAFPVGAYASAAFTHPYEYYFGIRRVPYSTDFTRDPLTFQHISDAVPLPNDVPIVLNGAPNSEVHNAGEVWASMLWECYAALLADTTGPTPRLPSFDAARTRMKDYLVESLKVTPANPTFLEARDALLLAAIANDQADYQLFLDAFARRGAGLGAVAPARASTDFAGVVESYSSDITPPTTSVALSSGTLGGNGWYTAAPTAAVTAASGFVIAPTARCVLDDPTHATLADLPDDPREPCDYLTPGARVPEGVHTVYAASSDVGGQTSPVTSSTVKVDSQPPVVECQPAEFYTGQTGAHVLAAVSDPTSGPVEASEASAVVDTSAPGPGTIQVTGHDLAGHATIAYCAYTVVGDTTPPTVSLSSGTGPFVRGTVTLTATAADQFGVDHVTFSVDGSAVDPPDDTAPYTLALDTTLLPDGAHSVSAVAVDPSNNESTVATVNLTVDNHAPAKPGLTALPPFTTAASIGLHYSGTDPGSGIASYTIQVRKAAYPATGLPVAWSNLGTVAGTAFTATALVRGTTYCFRVLARDKAGNVSVPSTQTCTARLVDDPALKHTAGWVKVLAAGFDGGSASRTTKANVSLSLGNVHARRLALRASTCPTCGSVKVLVGTTLVKTISLVSTAKKTAVLFTITLPKAMTGTVRITTRTAKVVTIDGLGLSHS